MQHLSLPEVADYLELATIEFTHDVGHAIIHTGRRMDGVKFVLVNNAYGESVLTEAL